MKASDIDSFPKFRKFMYGYKGGKSDLDISNSEWVEKCKLYTMYFSDEEKNMIHVINRITQEEYKNQVEIFNKGCQERLKVVKNTTDDMKKMALLIEYVNFMMPYAMIMPDIQKYITKWILKIANSTGAFLENDYDALSDHSLRSAVDDPNFITMIIE